jgi:hypothetical protein
MDSRRDQLKFYVLIIQVVLEHGGEFVVHELELGTEPCVDQGVMDGLVRGNNVGGRL